LHPPLVAPCFARIYAKLQGLHRDSNTSEVICKQLRHELVTGAHHSWQRDPITHSFILRQHVVDIQVEQDARQCVPLRNTQVDSDQVGEVPAHPYLPHGLRVESINVAPQPASHTSLPQLIHHTISPHGIIRLTQIQEKNICLLLQASPAQGNLVQTIDMIIGGAVSPERVLRIVEESARLSMI
jgi:hypothetical protein